MVGKGRNTKKSRVAMQEQALAAAVRDANKLKGRKATPEQIQRAADRVQQAKEWLATEKAAPDD
jgi:hypothetical protein